MDEKTSRYILYTGTVMSLLMLSGCAPWEWVKDKLGMGKKPVPTVTEVSVGVTHGNAIQPVKLQGRDDKVLVTMKGAPVITLKGFEQEFNQLIEENPQMKGMMQAVPDFKYYVLNQLIGLIIMDTYISNKRLDQSTEYLKDLERIHVAVKRGLNRKYFMQEFPVKVTDAEVKKFYDENKDKIPALTASEGGIQVVGIKFEKAAVANAFYDKVKGKSKEFDAIAKKEGLDKIQDFKLVNEQSPGINVILRNKIMALKKFPTVEMIKISDNEFWVVNASSKEEKQYRLYDEVKDYLKNDLEAQKEMKALEEAIENLKKEYNVIIDEEEAKALKPEVPVQEAAMASEVGPSDQAKETGEAPARTTKVA